MATIGRRKDMGRTLIQNGEYIGTTANGSYLILTDNDTVPLPKLLYLFWDEFSIDIDDNAIRADIISSYGINEETYNDMAESLICAGLIVMVENHEKIRGED